MRACACVCVARYKIYVRLIPDRSEVVALKIWCVWTDWTKLEWNCRFIYKDIRKNFSTILFTLQAFTPAVR